MARFSRPQVIMAMEEIGLVPVFYNADLETSKEIAAACARAGARVLEFVNRGDFAYQVFGEMVKYFNKAIPEIILGCGTIVDPYTAALYINNGSNFVVSPIFDPATAEICNRRKIMYAPGCGTASEIVQAEATGVEIVKVFPGGQLGGPAFVKSILGPCPSTKMMPTGGVSPTEESINGWFEAGVSCVGMGSKLITKDLVAAKDWKGIEENVRKTLALVKAAMQKKKS